MMMNNITYATDETTEEEILESQKESLNINDFIDEANKYTENVYDDIDIGDYLLLQFQER